MLRVHFRVPQAQPPPQLLLALGSSEWGSRRGGSPGRVGAQDGSIFAAVVLTLPCLIARTQLREKEGVLL